MDDDGSPFQNHINDEAPVGHVGIDTVDRTRKPLQNRGWRTATALSAVAVIVVGGTVVAATDLGGAGSASNDLTADRQPAGAVTSETLENPTRNVTGPVPASGSASCVEEYSPEGVANRAFAFDGVVTSIGPGQSNRGGDGSLDLAAVTFALNEWFSGGTSPTVTVDMERVPLPEGDPSYGVGSRLLVSGEPRWGGAPLDDPIAWGCEFTRYYDAPTADAWRKAITGAEKSR
ncbi:MAG: hypothetical protein M3O86_03130 [Actinomycetota bacterium]|nr:hypothetical protein [Actinomycetota bacterium]